MKKSTKVIIGLIVFIALAGIGLFLNNALAPVGSPLEFKEKSSQQTEETNLETYEEDFKAIDESLNNIG